MIQSQNTLPQSHEHVDKFGGWLAGWLVALLERYETVRLFVWNSKIGDCSNLLETPPPPKYQKFSSIASRCGFVDKNIIPLSSRPCCHWTHTLCTQNKIPGWALLCPYFPFFAPSASSKTLLEELIQTLPPDFAASFVEHAFVWVVGKVPVPLLGVAMAHFPPAARWLHLSFQHFGFLSLCQRLLPPLHRKW